MFLTEGEDCATTGEDFQVDYGESDCYSSSEDSDSSYDDDDDADEDERGGYSKTVKERVRKVESETESSGLVLIVLARRGWVGEGIVL